MMLCSNLIEQVRALEIGYACVSISSPLMDNYGTNQDHQQLFYMSIPLEYKPVLTILEFDLACEEFTIQDILVSDLCCKFDTISFRIKDYTFVVTITGAPWSIYYTYTLCF